MAIGRRTGLECQQSKAGGAKFEVCSHASGFLTALALLLLTFPKAAERPSMRKLLGAVAAAAILSAASTQAAWADPDKDESGHGRGQYKEEYKHDYRPGEQKNEWKSGDCKYERQSDTRGTTVVEKEARSPRKSGG